MKITTLTALGLTAILSTGEAATVNSLPLNYPVWALLGPNARTPVDVDMDGNHDVFIYADIDLLVRDNGVASPYHLMVATANDVYVSCFNVPIGPGPDGEPASVATFTTFAENENFDPHLSPPLWTWETGELPFHGFEIGGGIPSRDSYLGVKIVKESGQYYGWIRLIFPVTYNYIDETGYLKVKETSYQTVAATPIVAGAGKTEMRSSFSNSIKLSGNADIELEIKEVKDLTCQLLESVDLLSWETVTVKYSTESDASVVIPRSSSPRFYRWQITENLEEID
ncbi:MAG: hypothetical protein GVY36_04555 [Verrucomicrobia bacterium]|nr:hypothetical protein [Verrucomicrobiota bacterium]